MKKTRSKNKRPSLQLDVAKGRSKSDPAASRRADPSEGRAEPESEESLESGPLFRVGRARLNWWRGSRAEKEETSE